MKDKVSGLDDFIERWETELKLADYDNNPVIAVTALRELVYVLQSELHTKQGETDTLRTEYEQLRERVERLEDNLSSSM